MAHKVDIMSYNIQNTGNFSMSSRDFSVFCYSLYSYMQKGPYHFEISELFKQAATYLDNSILSKHNQSDTNRKNRQEYLFERFISLVKQHCSSEHSVKFYADKLCITSQYLSTISKKVSGRPACEWIYQFLILEAKALLTHTNLSIQEISFQMNFSDQSCFGKFFKKHTGVSPREYLRNLTSL